MKRKATSSIIATVTAIVLVAATMSGLLGCVTPASGYTEEEHIARVTRRARKRFIDSGEYTDLEVFPLYDENDELGYFLIELQPSGYAYVKLNRGEVSKWQPMYIIDSYVGLRWARTIYEKLGEAKFTDEFGNSSLSVMNRQFSEFDESGNPIYYKDSHFKVADIKDEKRYLLKVDSYGYIPAVKRSDNFFNLYSLEVFDLSCYENKEQIMTAQISFSFEKL